MAFMPAVWMLYRPDKFAVGLGMEVRDPRKGSAYLFAFLAGFYAIEDVMVAISYGSVLPLATLGHMVHYLLLLDFSGFLLAHLYNPEQLKSKLSCLLPN